VVDPLGGSYYIEALTQELVDKAWEIIERVETEGGMAKAVAAGWPKAMIEEAAAGRQARVDKGDDVIVGVNKYRLASEDQLDTLEVDNVAVREGQIARLKWVRETRDETKCRAALNALTEGAKTAGNLLELAVEAARQRATLGEISDAMELVFGRHGIVPHAGQGRLQRLLCRGFALPAGRRWRRGGWPPVGPRAPHARLQDGPRRP